MQGRSLLPMRRARRALTRSRVLGSALLLGSTLGLVIVGASPASAGNGGPFPQAFHPETAPGFTNTFTPPTASLQPMCPNGIAGTPGSDPATKILNGGPANLGAPGTLNTAASFTPGGTVHYVYTDDAHGAAANFTIQDCEVVYPAGFFQASDFDPTTGVLINPAFSKHVLDANGTMIDGASLSGISAPQNDNNIYYSWTSPTTIASGSWVCNFARDIRSNHGGGGNRKVAPTCYQVNQQVSPASLSLGYADSFRSTPGAITPTPWNGGTNPMGGTITEVGCIDPTNITACNGDQGFDAGAIRIDNPNTVSMTIDLTDSSVDIGPCAYAPWAGSITVGGHDSVILTETGGTPVAGCGNVSATPHDNFDTSEANEATQGSSCQQSGLIPQIHISIGFGGATPTTMNYTDSSQVLDTGGIDKGSCGLGNETTGWTPLV